MKRAYTLTELLVVITIVALLAALLFPIFAKARTQARRTACLSNLHQTGEAVGMYMADNQEHLPAKNPGFGYSMPGGHWARTFVNPLKNYGLIEQVMECPEAQLGSPANGLIPPAPPEIIEAGRRDHLLYNFQFDIVVETESAAEGNGPADSWRIEPEPSTVIAYCRWHLDKPWVLNQHDLDAKPGDHLKGEGQSQVQYVRSDGAALHCPASEVVFRALPNPPFTNIYNLPHRGQTLAYFQFPQEPDTLRLTKVDY